jgi:hypothetical protein
MRTRCWRHSVRNNLVFIAVALFAALACTKVSPPDLVKYNSDGDVPRVSVQDAKAEIDAGTAIIVDSRPEFAFKHERIKGAFNIPIGSPPEKFSEIPQGKKIFIYCS